MAGSGSDLRACLVEGEPEAVSAFVRGLEPQCSLLRYLPGPRHGRRLLLRGPSPIWVALIEDAPVEVAEEAVRPEHLLVSFGAFYGPLPEDQHEWPDAYDAIVQLVVEDMASFPEVEVVAALNATRDELPVSALLVPDAIVVGAVVMAVTTRPRFEGLGLVVLTVEQYVRVHDVSKEMWAGPWLA